VLGADTVVALDSQIFGKPRDLDHAAWMLRKLAGVTHQVITGIALMQANLGRSTLQAVCSSVTLRSLSAAEIDAYLKLVNPLDKAGAYAAQNPETVIIERLRGSFTNVVGLPMEVVQPLLLSAGVQPAG
jgi:septum formation protein